MKKLLFTILAMGVCAGAFAQNDYMDRNERELRNSYSANSGRGSMAIGGGLVYGTEIESIGIALRYDWMITNAFRLQPNATFFFKNDGLSSWDVNLDLQYLIPLSQRVRVYPLAGLTVSTWKWDLIGGGDDNKTYFGLNLGAGIEYDVAPNWLVNLDFRYRIMSDYDQAVIGVGFAYRF